MVVILENTAVQWKCGGSRREREREREREGERERERASTVSEDVL